MAYGSVKVDNIIFDNGGVDKLITVSGLFFSTSGALTVTGTISGGSVTAPTATFTTLTGTTTAGTTATFTSGSFTSLTGVTTTGTTATFTSGSFTSLTGVTTTVTSGIFGLGSAASPSIAFSGDTNNGIYSPGADQVAISTNGTSRIVVDASGNVNIDSLTFYVDAANNRVGIGTSSFAAVNHKLTVSGGYSVLNGLRISGADTENSIYQAGAFGLSSDNYITIGTGASLPERMRIDSSGRVGIGTSSPGVKLEARDSIAGGSDNTIATLHNFSDTGGDTRYAGLNFRIGSDNGTSAIRAFRTLSATDYRTNLSFWTNPTGATQTPVRAMTIDYLQRVGIGTASPGAIFHTVSAESGILGANISGNIYIESNTTAAAGVGGGIVFGGAQSGTTTTVAAGIKAAKSNGTAGDYGFDLAFYTRANLTAGSEKLRITSDGKVGIGTTTPGAPLEVVGSTSGDQLRINQSGQFYRIGREGSGGLLEFYGAQSGFNGYIFSGANGERMRIDGSGRLLVGTSSSISIGGASATVQIRGATGREHGLSITRSGGDATNSAPLLYLANEFNPVVNGSGLGVIGFAGHDGTDVNSVAAVISAEVDGTPGANDMPGRLVFSTTADGAASPTEAMRIKSTRIINFSNAPTYADNTAATAGGLAVGDVYKTVLGVLMIRF